MFIPCDQKVPGMGSIKRPAMFSASYQQNPNNSNKIWFSSERIFLMSSSNITQFMQLSANHCDKIWNLLEAKNLECCQEVRRRNRCINREQYESTQTISEYLITM